MKTNNLAHISTTERPTVVREAVFEELRPDTTPELGFQSYEMLSGSTVYRNVQKRQFVTGETRNPRLDYPKLLDTSRIDTGIRHLEEVLGDIQTLGDSEESDMAWNTVAYRMAEMYWIKEAARVNKLAAVNVVSPETLDAADRYQALNEELYGKPEPEVVAMIRGELYLRATAQELHPSVRQLYDELYHGTAMQLDDGTSVEIPSIGLSDADAGSRLPQNLPDRLQVLHEVLEEEYAPIVEVVDKYWEHTVEPRHGKNEFTRDDMVTVFEQVHRRYDPVNRSGIKVRINPGSTQLAWDTPSMSILVGDGRIPIDDKQTMVAKLIHEYGKHAGGAVSGLKTDMPLLGIGLYTDAEEGGRADYLTFEEGLASMAEMAANEDDMSWRALHISRYLAVACAYEGMDFRQVYETNWRARVVMEAGSDEVSAEKIDAHKKQAYLSTVRVFRGAPTEHPVPGKVLTYNKDLAYLAGKLDVLKFLDEVGNDKARIRQALRGKFDPNNPLQQRIADKFIPTDDL